MQAIVDVMNLALANLANLNQIQTPSEKSPEGEQMLARWQTVLETVLTEHPWGFASKREGLARLNEAADYGYIYYAYPPDSVKIRRVHPAGQPRRPLAFSIGQAPESGQKAIIIFEEELPVAVYTSNAVPVPIMPADFVAALAWRLAAETALAKRADPEIANAGMGAYQTALGLAKLHDAQETGPRPEARSRWKGVRFG